MIDVVVTSEMKSAFDDDLSTPPLRRSATQRPGFSRKEGL